MHAEQRSAGVPGMLLAAAPVLAPSPLAGLGWWPRCLWRRLVTPAPLSNRGHGACRQDSLARSEQPAKAACAACPCQRRRWRRRISFARPISSCPRLCMDAESPQEGAVKAFNVRILQGRSEFWGSGDYRESKAMSFWQGRRTHCLLGGMQGGVQHWCLLAASLLRAQVGSVWRCRGCEWRWQGSDVLGCHRVERAVTGKASWCCYRASRLRQVPGPFVMGVVHGQRVAWLLANEPWRRSSTFYFPVCV